MSVAKLPRGDVLSRDYLLPLPPRRLIRIPCVIALAAFVLGSAMFKVNVEAGLNKKWAHLTDQTPTSLAFMFPGIGAGELFAPIDPESIPLDSSAWVDQKVRTGDTLSQIFKRAGFAEQDVQDVINQSRDGESLELIFPGQTIAFEADSSGQLIGVKHTKSQLETVTYLRTDAGFESEVNVRSPELREAWTTGVINSSLFLAGQEAGLSQSMILDMANLFGGVVDFALDPRRGDTMQLVYEELYVDGEKFKDGEIIAASFTNQGETFNAFRYTDSHGDTNYYNEEGVSMRKSFLMAPLDFTRISSNFNMRRMHPVYKTTRPHRGTDYAAPTGTPVYAAGDGRVIKAGYTSTNGNYVCIQHGDQYVTKYLHLQKRMVTMGQRVSQSQVIGTVGSTGLATGPHLHYEFLVDGVHHNPRTIVQDLPKAQRLPEREMANFRQAIHRANFQLAVLRSSNQLAMNNSTGSKHSSN